MIIIMYFSTIVIYKTFAYLSLSFSLSLSQFLSSSHKILCNIYLQVTFLVLFLVFDYTLIIICTFYSFRLDLSRFTAYNKFYFYQIFYFTLGWTSKFMNSLCNALRLRTILAFIHTTLDMTRFLSPIRWYR